MSVVGTVEAKFTADISDMQAKLDTIVDKMGKTKNASEGMTTSVFKAEAAWDLLKKGVEVVTRAIEDSISAFNDDQKAVTDLYIVTQNMGKSWTDMSAIMESQVKNALDNTTFSSEETVNALTRLTTAGLDGADASTALAAAQNAAIARGLDLSTVIMAITRGAQGYAKGLVTLGINQAEVKASTDKVANITKQLGDLYGGAAQAQANTFAGKMQQLNNNLDEIKVTVMEQVIPALYDLVSPITDVTKAINSDTVVQFDFQEKIYRTVEYVKLLGDGLKFLGGIALELVSPFIILGTVVGDTLSGQFTKAYNDIQHITDGINSLVADSAKGMAADWAGATQLAGIQYHTLAGDVLSYAKATGSGTENIFDDAVDKIALKLYDFNKALTKLTDDHRDALKKLKDQAIDLTTALDKENQNQKANEDDTIAGILQSHLDKQKELKQQLTEATAFGKDIDEAHIADLQGQLSTENAFLSKHADDVSRLSSTMALDDIDKEKTKAATEKAQREQDYHNKLTDLVTQLQKEQDAYKSSLSDLGVQYKDQFDSIRDFISKTASPQIVAVFKDMVTLSNAELAKINLPTLGTDTTSATSASITAPKVKNLASTSGLNVTNKSAITSNTNSSKVSNPSFNVNFYGNQTFSTPSQQNALTEQIRKVMMNDYQNATFNAY